jgi:hypothetical protein
MKPGTCSLSTPAPTRSSVLCRGAEQWVEASTEFDALVSMSRATAAVEIPSAGISLQFGASAIYRASSEHDASKSNSADVNCAW